MDHVKLKLEGNLSGPWVTNWQSAGGEQVERSQAGS
jgi:hypothetical protein